MINGKPHLQKVPERWTRPPSTGGSPIAPPAGADWKHWGPWVSERSWGTVREDYHPFRYAWSFFPPRPAAAAHYRWNEHGLAGFCNRFQNLCSGLASSGTVAIRFLKEHLFA